MSSGSGCCFWTGPVSRNPCRYFASHEDLISAVIADLYDELTAVLVALPPE